MSYWNPIERYGVDALRARPRRGRRSRRHHARPDPRRGRRLAARRRRPPPRHGLPGRTVVHRRAASRMTVEACRGFVYAASTMGVTGARAEVGDAAAALVARIRARSPTCRSPSGSACRPATRPPRWPASPTASSSARRSSGACSTPTTWLRRLSRRRSWRPNSPAACGGVNRSAGSRVVRMRRDHAEEPSR